MKTDESTARPPIVCVDGLTVRYGSRVALDGVSLAVDEGVVGLLGPNGAGKSTLLKTLLGFVAPALGTATLFGIPIASRAMEARQRVGYMPEHDVTSPKLSAVSFVSYCGCLAGMEYRTAVQRAHEVLNYVGFGEERYRAMETYSTGMRQRAKLAQALVHDPRLLLLDEPTNGLDPIGRIAMLDLIKDIARIRDVAILLSSHLLPDVEHVCQRVVLFDQGKVVREGTLTELMRYKGQTFTLRLKEGTAAFAAAVGRIGCDASLTGDGALLVHHTDGVNPADVFRLVRECGYQVRHFAPVQQRLEEVFLDALAAKE